MESVNGIESQYGQNKMMIMMKNEFIWIQIYVNS